MLNKLIVVATLGAVLGVPSVALASTTKPKPEGSGHNSVWNGVGDTKKSVTGVGNHVSVTDIDVRFTRNNIPVAMHNRSIAATTHGRGYVDRKKWDQLKSIRTNDGSNIPSLRWVREYAERTGKDFLFIDLKVKPTPTQWQRLNKALGSFKSRTYLTSVKWSRVAAGRSHGFKVTYATTGPLNASVTTLKRLKVRAVWGGITRYSPTQLNQIKSAGIKMIMRCDTPGCWTWGRNRGVWVFSTEHAQQYKAWGNTS